MASKEPKSNPPAPIYLQMRQRVLETDPGTVGIHPSDAAPQVWGVLMEFMTGGTHVTLVSLVDGTTSMYFGNGGGIIGGGGDADVAQASRDLNVLAESYLDDFVLEGDLRLPVRGETRFIILTYDGAYASAIQQSRLFKGNHFLTPLFNQSNRVISMLRFLQESSEKKSTKEKEK
jgi:hypothetical protein